MCEPLFALQGLPELHGFNFGVLRGINQWEGVAATDGGPENRVENNFSASIAFAASEGWNASQNT
jgi:hypothetical protein